MNTVQKKKILSLDITLKRLRASDPSVGLNGAGIYWTFKRGDPQVICGIFQAGKRWVFATSMSHVSEAQEKALLGKLRPLAYYDEDLDEVIRVCNKKASQVKQIVDETLGREITVTDVFG